MVTLQYNYKDTKCAVIWRSDVFRFWINKWSV